MKIHKRDLTQFWNKKGSEVCISHMSIIGVMEHMNIYTNQIGVHQAPVKEDGIQTQQNASFYLLYNG